MPTSLSFGYLNYIILNILIYGNTILLLKNKEFNFFDVFLWVTSDAQINNF